MNINVKKVKIVITTPLESVEEIRQCLGDAGAGIIGNYSHCSISVECIGTFKGNDGTNPYIGTKNQLESVKEIKVEANCDIEKVEKVLEHLRKVHPYEEPSIDIYPLLEESDL